MSLSNVYDVDIISDASTVIGSVVSAVDLKAPALSSSHLQENRNNVSFRTMVFAEPRRGAGCVEIAERDVFEPNIGSHFRKNTLEKELGSAVGIDRIRRMVFGNGRVPWFSVCCGG